MKTIKHIASLFALAASMLAAGCNDFLNKEPLDTIKDGQYWNSQQDAELWLLGMYDEVQKTLGDNYFVWGESRSDNIVVCGAGTDQMNYLQNVLTSSLDPCNWNSLYRAVSSANFAIKYFPTVPDVTPENLDRMMAEAYAVRALMYFYAIRVWGPVPLITTPYEGLAGQKKFYERSPVEDVKEQILKDISIAHRLFAGATSGVYRMSAGSVLALKADVHMWFDEYEEAVETTDDIIGMKRYSLAANATEWKLIFDSPDLSKETMFAVSWDPVTDGQNGVYTYLSKLNPRYKVRKALWDTLVVRKTDQRWLYMTDTVRMWYVNRKAAITESTYDRYSNDFYFNKFSKYNPSKSNSDVTDMPEGGYDYPSPVTYMPSIMIYRYSDIMLLRAEALNMTDRSSEARTIVNDLRKRIGYCYKKTIPDGEDGLVDIWVNEVTPQNTPDGEALAAVILQERQIELYGEGKRWFDLARTGNVKKFMDPILVDYGYPEGFGDIRRVLFPLHTSVFEANPLLYQNEPYSQH